jgi:hypothetical protein
MAHSQIIIVLSHLGFTSVFNQSTSHWLVNDPLNSTISICLKLIEEYGVLNSFEFWKRNPLLFLSFFGL